VGPRLYLGGPGVDYVTAYGADDVLLGGDGDDSVHLSTTGSGTTVAGNYDGGAGDDGIFVFDQVADVEMELDEQVVVDGVPVASITGFTNGGATAPRVALRGNAEDNSLYVSGCDLRVNGEGGDDRVTAGYVEDVSFPQPCDRRARLSGGRGDDTVYGWTGSDRLAGNAGDDNIHGRGDADLLLGGTGDDNLVGGGGPDVLRGQRGHDKLIGNPGSDTLVGDQGRDTAGGGAGRDRCSAEVERRCDN
jgi:Ca2+-binding RTX toxin-like protein